MTIEGTDLIVISRGGVHYKAPVSDLPASGGADSRAILLETDFATTQAEQGGFAVIATGSGTFNTVPAAATLSHNHPGVQLWRSSATSGSGVYCQTTNSTFRLGGGEQWDVNFRTMAAFTNITFRSAALDTVTASAPTDGAYFEFVGSGAIVGKCRRNSVESVTATLATLAVSTWYHGRITINADATSVLFEVFDDAGTLLGSASLTTNIPTASGREVNWGSIATHGGTAATDLIAMDRQRLTVPGRTLARGAA